LHGVVYVGLALVFCLTRLLLRFDADLEIIVRDFLFNLRNQANRSSERACRELPILDTSSGNMERSTSYSVRISDMETIE
jgi:hypothetical protein